MILDLFALLRILFRHLVLRDRPPSHLLPQSRLKFRVALRDLDLNLHMNNSRYLARMDLGRWDLFLTMGLIRILLRQKINAVVVDLKIRYRKELRYGTLYELRSYLKGLENRKLWVRQEFWRGDQLCAEAEVGILFLHRGKPISAFDTIALFRSLGYPDPPRLKEQEIPQAPPLDPGEVVRS